MQDLTMSQVLKDPLIRQMLRADQVSLGEFAMLLEKAAADRARRLSAKSHPLNKAFETAAEVHAN
ncbi:MAG: hypothetical protein KGI75_26010 [Rhizobiaceae bacterium]|nr:hypothetical protein [Rhizobiaceae bacterium]